MKITFRADSSLLIGTGHVMRCLALADALAGRGADCRFICRAFEGNLIEFIRGKGYVTEVLPVVPTAYASSNPQPPDTQAYPNHTHWLGSTQAHDANACAPILAKQCPDWLIVDHYAIDAEWERALAPHYRKLMVIDDLADRPHACDMLVDQTFGRNAADYRLLVPAACHLLCGSQYALLRPEFAALRAYSLQRRAHPALRELVITMGGVDKDNATGQVLEALRTCPLPADCRITVVMGATAAWLDTIRSQAQDIPWPTRVMVSVRDMARVLADSDLAIGAAGVTSWERCRLGVPSIMLVLAENQRKIAEGLQQAGAAKFINFDPCLRTSMSKLLLLLFENHSQLLSMSRSAASITDGLGTRAVIQEMVGYSE